MLHRLAKLCGEHCEYRVLGLGRYVRDAGGRPSSYGARVMGRSVSVIERTQRPGMGGSAGRRRARSDRPRGDQLNLMVLMFGNRLGESDLTDRSEYLLDEIGFTLVDVA